MNLREIIRSIINPVRLGIGWGRSFLRGAKRGDDFLSVCAIAKNEGRYFKEWLDYHILIGVDKFYIYNNESDDNTLAVLKPYIKRGIVEYINFPGNKMQRKAYRDAQIRARFASQWLIAIDLDEFIVGDVVSLLKSAPENVHQISFASVEFGTSGHEKRPAGLVIENYLYRSDKITEYKSVARPRFIATTRSVHRFEVVGLSTDAQFNPANNLRQDETLALPLIPVRINHYKLKSLEDARAKAKRGDALWGRDYEKFTEKYIRENDDNSIYDDEMLEFAEHLGAKKITKPKK